MADKSKRSNTSPDHAGVDHVDIELTGSQVRRVWITTDNDDPRTEGTIAAESSGEPQTPWWKR